MNSKNGLGGIAGILLSGALLVTGSAAYGQAKKTPYWASISEPEARMRVGPSLDYPSNWIYRRRDLPVRVVQVLGNWRKVEDPSGTQGWMHVRLLSDTATAIVVGDAPVELREGPGDSSRLLYRAEPGVVGRVQSCSDGWCAINVQGQQGYARASSLWGAVQ